MKIDPPLFPATLIKRYKRFLADVRLDDGTELTVHTPNTGSMLGCAEPGMRILLRDTQNPKRKYLYSWEMSETADGTKIGVNTGLSNQLVSEAIENGAIDTLRGYDSIQTEVKYGQENSRIDLLLSGKQGKCYIEIKNVTAADKNGLAIFPDAVTQRGTKHLRELRAMVEQGHRAVIFFSIQRQDITGFRPAWEIDPLYAKTLKEVLCQGVEVMAWQARVEPSEVVLVKSVPIYQGVPTHGA
ncbi:MAG: DNA/RNA nuclease SfsA [Gammaproteobacteria bacterium]|nr:DNA/RNA nuclease SfsA [Gammaproteobacteria bacterium]